MKKRDAARRRSSAGLRASAPLSAPNRGPAAMPAPIAPSRPRGPRCPKCEMYMQHRKRTSDGRPFWGCARFPHCRETIAMDESIAAIATSPSGHPLFRIGRRTHRTFAAEMVRRTYAGESYGEIIVGAMRAAFPSSYRLGDDALRQRGLALALEATILSVVREILDAQP